MSTPITLLNLNSTLTVKKAAGRVHITQERLQTLLRNGQFPQPDVNLNDNPRWHVDTLDAWRDDQK